MIEAHSVGLRSGMQGNYAFAVMWSDGHTSSLYTYDHLTKIIEEEEAAAGSASAAQTEEQKATSVVTRHHSH